MDAGNRDFFYLYVAAGVSSEWNALNREFFQNQHISRGLLSANYFF